MTPQPLPTTTGCPGLVWGFDFIGDVPRILSDPDLKLARPVEAGFRWLHLNLADQRTRRWLEGEPLPALAKELLLSIDDHPRAVVDGKTTALVMQDIERDFDADETRLGAIRVALSPGLMLTLRRHPLRSGDVVRRQLLNLQSDLDEPGALEMLLSGMAEIIRRITADLDETVQDIEDDLLKDARQPETRAFVNLRSVMAKLRRQLSGQRAVLRRLEEDPALAEALKPVVDRASSRLNAMDAELVALQSQLRLLRDELDLQAAQQTNQNLYVLSIMTALMLPATLVTGFFGMNTGGMPLTHGWWGTAIAAVLAVVSALAVYLALRLMGLVRR